MQAATPTVTGIRARTPAGLVSLGGLGAAMAVRAAIAGPRQAFSLPGAAAFAAILVLTATGCGWRWRALLRDRAAGVGIGMGGGAVLLAAAVVVRPAPGITLGRPSPGILGWWALLVLLVAVSEEVLLRGVLFDAVSAAAGPVAATVAGATAFAFLHVPLYGWRALPLDFAVGVWLGGLRLATGGVTAPAAAHALADLAACWLL